MRFSRNSCHPRTIVQRDRMHADRDPTLALEIHRVELLVFEIARFNRSRDFEQTVGKRRLPVIDMRDDAEVADALRDVGAVGVFGLEGQDVF